MVGGTPLHKPYRYVPPPRVGFLGLFGLKTGRYILPILVWNQVWFSRELWECVDVFIVSKKERQICKFEIDFGSGLKTGVENDIFWSEIGSGSGKLHSTPTILRSNLPPTPPKE